MASAPDPSAPDPIETFIARWQGREGGQERANLSLFINDFCKALALQPPDPAAATIEHNDFVYERRVDEPQPVGPPTARRIDLYKRAAFILEAKQSRQPGGRKALPEQLAIPTIAEPTRRGTRATAARAWDVLMFNARKQAQDYARHLAAKSPLALVMAIPDHPWTKLSPDAAAVRIAMTVAASGGAERWFTATNNRRVRPRHRHAAYRLHLANRHHQCRSNEWCRYCQYTGSAGK